jgi:hypothetical protein
VRLESERRVLTAFDSISFQLAADVIEQNRSPKEAVAINGIILRTIMHGLRAFKMFRCV